MSFYGRGRTGVTLIVSMGGSGAVQRCGRRDLWWSTTTRACGPPGLCSPAGPRCRVDSGEHMTIEGANYEGLERFNEVDATGEEQMFVAFLDRVERIPDISSRDAD